MTLEVVGFDTETHLIQPGLLAPPLVCGSLATRDGGELLDKDGARSVFRELMRARGLLVGGANFPFDVAVMLADAEARSRAEYDSLVVDVFDKYEAGEIHDVLLGQALDAIAKGHLFRDPRTGGDLRDPITREVKNRYSLAIVTDLNLGRRDAKIDDYFRERFAILEHVPFSEWSPDARKYPVTDAINTRDNVLYQLGGAEVRVREHAWLTLRNAAGQEIGSACEHCMVELGFGEPQPCIERAVVRPPFRNIEGMPRDTRADLVLHLGAVWGLRTNRQWVDALTVKVDQLHADRVEEFRDWMKAGHKPGCLKRMALAGVTPDSFRGRDHCVTTCTDGKENGPLVTRLVAEAYGVTGVCPSCGGRGRRMGAKGNDVGCVYQYFKHEPNAVCCDTTGLDLSTAPNLPRTDGNGVKCDRDTLIESGDERLMLYGDDEFEKVRGTYLPYLRLGLDYPLNLRPNAMLETFRMSYSGPSQHMPREGEPRVCHEARPGFVYFSDDYSGIELCTLAQVCLWKVGFSRMAEIINASGDPGGIHAAFGAQMAGMPEAEFKAKVKAGDKTAKDFRQAAKAANFGYPGGMGSAKLVATKRKKNEGSTYSPTGPLVDKKGNRYYTGIRFCILLGGAERCGVKRVTEWRGRETPPVCEACCIEADILRDRWMEFFPEIRRYFNVVKREVDDHAEVRLPFPGCVRGGVGFTDGANGNFQELAALLMRLSMWRMARECYADKSSILYGTTRVPVIIHDEAFGETKIDTAHLAAPRIGTIMVEAGREILPNVAIKVEPAISRRWLKAMEPAYDVTGKLICWEDSPAGRKYLAEKEWTL